MKKSLLLKIVVIVFAFVGFISVANAQVTTSSLTGTVKDSKEALPGAGVKATHTPTGTVYGVATNGDGRYTIGNMRVGGPYTIEVSFVGYKTQTFNDVYLKLGEPFVLNVTLQDNSSTLNTVTIVGGAANPIMNSNKSGANTVVSRQQIQNLPTIGRSVNDITRLTPQANGTSIGGGNYRSNNFSVDGANFNNQFGIGQNLPANGSPISIDALEQISINVTPYDVRQSGFTGGSVNAVTRSGTNKFFGSAFYLLRGEEEQGNKVEDVTFSKQKFDQKQYGFSFGGPIIKNKLFFFVNAELSNEAAPGQSKIAATPAYPFKKENTNAARPTAVFLDQVKSYLLSKYNYDPGSYQGYDNLSNNNKFLARLDWNISQNHSFNIRYNQVESKSPSFVSTSTSGTGFSYSQTRQSNQALHFSNSNYYQDANLYSWAAELNSKLSDKISNKLRGSYAHQNDPRSSDSEIFPFVDILEAGTPITSFGYEPFTYGNLRDVTTYNINDDLSINLGKHGITLGLQAEFSTTKNGFQRFGTSLYSFNSWADFVNGAKPANFAITYPLTADGSQAFPSFKFAQYSAYIQDEFTISDRLKLTAGLRVENPTYPDVTEVKTHPLVAQLSFNGEKVNTGALPDTKLMFSPRLGFNWDVNGDRSFQVRGGSGVFTGRIPFVWIVAQSGDAGMLQFLQTYNGQANTPGPFNPDPKAYIPASKPTPGTAIPSAISIMSPDLKFPQTWKSSLGFDFKLPLGFIGTIEGIYNKDINTVAAKNMNLQDAKPLNIAGYPDNRPMFNAGTSRYINKLTSAGLVTPTATGAFDVTKMYNVSSGSNYWSASAQVTKNFSKGLSMMLAYTKSGGKSYGDGAGDQIINLWSIPPTAGSSNIASLGYNGNVLPDRVIASLSYRKEWLGNLATSISLFYEGAIQGKFSYTYGADYNRDNQFNDLIYVPKDASEITFVPLTITVDASVTPAITKTFTPQEQSDAFFAYVNQDSYLKSRMGKYAERNGAELPWRNQVDLKLTQEVFKNVGGGKNSFQFTCDIFNFGNLVNSKWGAFDAIRNSQILVPTNMALVNATTKPTFRMANASGDLVRSTTNKVQTIRSTYYMQFGFRYNFN